MASTYLTRTPSTGVNRRTFTFSAWIKRARVNDYDIIFEASNGSHTFQMATNPTGDGDCIKIYDYTGTTNLELKTNQAFRDLSAWYHIVIAIDTTQATSTNRAKFYVNGEQVTSFATSTYPSQNYDTGLNNSVPMQIGRQQSTSYYFNGSMSHIHYIDGTAYDASAFGEYDTNGVWKIKTSPSVTYGTNGFFILKDGNSVTDQSPNTNNFTVAGGTLTNTEDSPSNVFNTLNPLDGYQSGYTYAQGNTAVASTSGSRTYVTSTLAMPSGKYYWECKLDATIGDSGGASTSVYVGITGQSPISPSQFPSDGTCFNCVMNTNGQVYSNGSTIGSAMGSGWSTSTFVMMAYDADNNKMYFGKDGVWLNSGDPTSGATGTGAFTPTTAASATPIGVYMPQWGVDFNASYGTSFNFGNGYFGTTAVTTAGTNASGIGIFEYDVPTGYTALCTKGLNL
jgi:hypothetical protein